MIHFGLKTIFIHIPRTAGNSISSELYKYPNYLLLRKHIGIKFFYDNYKEEFETFFKFTCVRNPFEKVYSSYNFRIINGKEDVNEKDFNTWIKNNVNGKNAFSKPQLNFITLNNKIKIDYIIKYEDLENGFNYVCNKLGIEINKLPHLFPTYKNDYKYIYNKKSIEIVNKIFKKDLDYFGYEF